VQKRSVHVGFNIDIGGRGAEELCLVICEYVTPDWVCRVCVRWGGRV
jgi:hypothetical protein